MNLPKIAICYDFDSTLSPNEMQSYGYFKALGTNSDEFWGKSDIEVKNTNADRTLINMLQMIKEAKNVGITITREKLREFGASVELFQGVTTWFDRINEYGKSLGVNVEHFIVSSGDKEMIMGTPIAKNFKKIYACEFHYNASGNADWPKQTVNYTTKTQFIFRISKGVLDVLDDVKLNTKMKDDDRRIPYQNMIYFGDGLTDVPCMKLVKQYGGHSIAIFNKKEKHKVEPLLRDDRVNFICEGNYKENSHLEQIVKQIIKKVVADNELNDISNEQIKHKRY